MWSVWSKPVQVYLGSSVALLQPVTGPEVRVQTSPTLPWPQRLQRITQAGGPAVFGRKPALSITLSAALCPPVAFTVPQGVRDWREMEVLAQASVASQWGVSPEAVRCELAAGTPGLAAAMMQGLHADLVNWAQTLGASITALQPLWAVASQCPAARSDGVKALWLQEPDGSTLLALPSGQVPTALHVPEMDRHDGTTADSDAPLRRTMTGLGLGPDELLRLRFDASTPETGLRHSPASAGREPPALWDAHWQTGGTS